MPDVGLLLAVAGIVALVAVLLLCAALYCKGQKVGRLVRGLFAAAFVLAPRCIGLAIAAGTVAAGRGLGWF